MKLPNRERLLYTLATVAVVLAAVGALFTTGDLELTLVMAAAVVTGLVCFDTAMERRLKSFGPWLFVSVAPILKTVPMVWQELRSESGASFERYDHVGTLLWGGCVFGAVVMLSRPSAKLGQTTSVFDAAVVAGSAVISALAGASVAFLFDADFGSATAGRVLETPTWFVIGGMVAAATIAASRATEFSGALMALLAGAAASTALLAFSVAGRDFDRGWWAVLFAWLAIGAAMTEGQLGTRESRVRLSNVSVVVAMVAGMVAAAAAISARSDRVSWGPGWALLGVMSLAMFALAMASKPLDEQRRAQRLGGKRLQDIGVDEDEGTAQAKARSLATVAIAPAPDVVARADRANQPLSPTSAPAPAPAPVPQPLSPSPAPAPVPQPLSPSPAPTPVPQPLSPSSAPAPVPQPSPIAATVAPQPVAPQPVAPQPVAPQPVAPQPVAPQPVAPQPVAAQPIATLSDATIVASARDAAAVRTAPSAQRHSLAPLAQAHHFDPSTGLLSAAGLQHAIARAFDVPRRAGHVTIMMFMIRDLDRIERDHGRLASAAVTREVADRVNTLLPDGSGARFARSAYAIIFVGDMSNANETVQRLARVLLRLRAPVEGGSLGDKIDVVAGMAQCYEGEDAAQFVVRANQGLARAVQTPEPTFVAMP